MKLEHGVIRMLVEKIYCANDEVQVIMAFDDLAA